MTNLTAFTRQTSPEVDTQLARFRQEVEEQIEVLQRAGISGDPLETVQYNHSVTCWRVNCGMRSECARLIEVVGRWIETFHPEGENPLLHSEGFGKMVEVRRFTREEERDLLVFSFEDGRTVGINMLDGSFLALNDERMLRSILERELDEVGVNATGITDLGGDMGV